MSLSETLDLNVHSELLQRYFGSYNSTPLSICTASATFMARGEWTFEVP